LLKYIAVAGNIGAGKTSLVEFLRGRYDLLPFYEPNEENPYLWDFYRDMASWSFHSQVYFLSKKARLHQRLQKSRGTAIQDRTIYEDAEIFARNLYTQGLMDPRDFATYWELYEALKESLRPPDVLIYLHSDLKTIKKRIAARGRETEQAIPTNYLKRLQRLYKRWIGAYDLSPVIKLHTDKLDYVSDLVDQIELLDKIERYII
jgi:deoxyadenosine/deoxycytidine kinase